MANESTTTATIELELVALDGSVRKVSLAAGQTSIEAAPGVRIERVPEGLRLSIEGEEVSLPWQAELTFAGLVWRLADAPGKSAQGGQSTADLIERISLLHFRRRHQHLFRRQ